jgi:rod shape-determining protein MreB
LHSPLQCPNVAIDLGSANTRLFAAGRGLLAETPSIVGEAFHPLRRGVIVDIGAAAELLEPLFGRVRRLAAKPRTLACVPSDASEDERRALRQAARAAGARDVAIVAEPLAAAIGAGLDVASEYAQMLVDLGDGITDIAVIRSGELIRTDSLRVGCSDLREAVLSEGMAGGDADRVIRELCAQSASTDGMILVLERIATFVDDFVRDLPHSVAAEVIENGICATGGGAKLRELINRIRTRCGLPIAIADDPLHAVIRGAGLIVTGPGAKRLWAN